MTDAPGDAWTPAHGGPSDEPPGHLGAGTAADGRLRAALADGSPPVVLLLLPAGRNRRLLAGLLNPETTVTATTDVGALTADVDLCIVDQALFDRHRETIVERRAAADSIFLPVVLLDPGNAAADPKTWTAVDEVIPVPVSTETFRARLEHLLVRRRQSRRLAEREAELDAALTELRVRDRAIAAAPVGITIAEAREGNPIVYANDAFLALTGYDRAEVVGRNRQFLQGPGTDEASVREIRAAMAAAEPVSVDLVNYTRDGERFWNEVEIAPVRDDAGDVTHFVGFQTDVTTRTLHEQRVNVLNRLLRHNLRNELNIIDGYTEALADEDEDGIEGDSDGEGEGDSDGEGEGDSDGEGKGERARALDRIHASVERLTALSEEVRHVERVFGDSSESGVRSIASLLDEVRARLGERYPDVTVRLDAPDEPVYVNGGSLSLGCVDYLAMLLSTNDRDDRWVSIAAAYDDDAGVVTVELADNGPGLTEAEWAVVEAGHETPLEHADRLGLWVLRWVTTTVGGELLRSDGGDGRLQVRCPVRDPPAAGSDERADADSEAGGSADGKGDGNEE